MIKVTVYEEACKGLYMKVEFGENVHWLRGQLIEDFNEEDYELTELGSFEHGDGNQAES